MNLGVLLRIAAIYMGIVGLGLILAPRAFGRGALPADASTALIAFLRLWGSPLLGIAVLDWLARDAGPSKARDAIILGNMIGFFRHRPRGHLGLPRWRAPGDEALRRRPLALCSGLRLGRSKVRARRGGIGRPRSHLLPQRPSNPAASHGSARSSSAPCWRPPSDGCIVVPAGNGWTATRRALPLDLWRGTEGMQRDLTTFMRGAAIAVALTLAASKAIWAQSQNPSPMVETTRAHERLERVELSGVSGSVPGPEGRDVEIFVPSAFTARTPATLVIHFHGAAWLPERAVAGLGKNAVSAVVDLGGGGTRYDRAFSASHTFQRLVDDITRTVSELAGGTVRVDTVVLTAFSAGYGAIRAILRDPDNFARVDAVLLLDGLHTSYVPERTVLAEGAGSMNPVWSRSPSSAAQRWQGRSASSSRTPRSSRARSRARPRPRTGSSMNSAWPGPPC